MGGGRQRKERRLGKKRRGQGEREEDTDRIQIINKRTKDAATEV